MATFNVQPTYFRHIKTIRLKTKLGPTADVYPLRLWAMLTEFDPDGGTCRDLTGEEIEAVMNWAGTSGLLIDTLIDVGYLEMTPEGRYRAHDWQEHEGHLKAYRDRAKAASDRRWGQFPTPKPAQNTAKSSEDDAGDAQPFKLMTTLPPLPERALAAITAVSACQRVKLTDGEALRAWAMAYPDVDIAGEIRKADAWAVTNSVTRSAKGWAKTMNTWLSKEQDKIKAAPKRVGAASPVKGKYDHLG